LHHIQLLEELNHFGDLGVFDNSFVSIFDTETDPNQYISRWLNGDPEATEYVESRFTRIPFEQAYCYKNPEYQTKPRTELLKNVFGENTEWRNLSDKQNHTQIIKHFEYMCYYVINTRDELLFDVMYF
jgi:hypothetical protein